MSDKSRSFSVFLLKKEYSAANCLEADHRLKLDATATSLPEGSSLYILDNPEKQPWWKPYFGVTTHLPQQTKGALAIIPVGSRHFALAFGHVQHNLLDGSYVYDFGLKVTLNSVDPARLKSTDTIEPGASRRKRTQLPNESELTLFDFDQDSSVLKSLTGKVREDLSDIFKQPTGSANLRISTSLQLEELPALCKKLLELYDADTYLTTFPDIRSIEPVRDPHLIANLDASLESAVRTASREVLLAVPDFLDYSSASHFTFTGLRAGSIYDDIFIDRYYEYVSQSKTKLEELSGEDLRKHKLCILNENETPIKTFSVYKCILFETELPGSTSIYHLNEGTWYKFESNLVGKLRSYLDACYSEATLPQFLHANEDEYNKWVSASNPRYILLDKANISPKGQKQIEPCDLLHLQDGEVKLIHVKISTVSASLSHLFAQGLTSIELLRDEPDAVENLGKLLEDRHSADFSAAAQLAINQGKVSVLYAIITHKDPSGKSNNLPLFSRLSLARALKTLRRMNVHREFTFIRDINKTKPGKKKSAKTREAETFDIDDIVEDLMVSTDAHEERSRS